MATGNEYRQFILDQLAYVPGIRLRPMMGEYLLYEQHGLGALIRQAFPPGGQHRLRGRNILHQQPVIVQATHQLFLLVEEVDDRAFLAELMETLQQALPAAKTEKRIEQP